MEPLSSAGLAVTRCVGIGVATGMGLDTAAELAVIESVDADADV